MQIKFPLILVAAAFCSSSWAATLQDVRQAAEASDPQWKAAQRTWQADQQISSQALGALLPNVTASYGRDRVWNKLEDVGDKKWHRYNRETTAVELQQPLFRLDAWFGYKQAKAVVSSNEAKFKQERQAFLLRVATQYIDVLRSWEMLQFAMANEKSIGRQLEQVQERYKVGLVAVTDVQQAQSTYDGSRVTLISAQSQFDIARDQLQVLTGKSWETLARLKQDLPMDGVMPADPAQWIELAQQQNPQLKASEFAAKAQDYNADVKLGAMLPRLSLSAGYQHQHSDGNTLPGGGGGLGLDTQGKNIGIQVVMPLFAGGTLNSQRKEAALRAEAAESTYELVFRQTSQAARSQYRLVETDALNVKAGAQAVKSARTALDAVREGYNVGTKTIIDVLNAESALLSARNNHAAARYDYIIDSLSLKATAGVLKLSDLEEISTWLDDSAEIDLHQVELKGQYDSSKSSSS